MGGTVQKRGEDAGKQAPKPKDETPPGGGASSSEQDAPNYADRTDGGRAIPAEDMSSANDE